MRLVSFLALALALPFLPLVARAAAGTAVEVDALLAKVGRDSVLLSDLRKFSDVYKVLECAGVVKREQPLPSERRALLDAYVEEELLYQEARVKKFSTAGQIPLSVQQIQAKASCKEKWLALGDRYGKLWKTENRAREGEGMLVRELEKRILVERFRKSEAVPDLELFRREAALRYPVKVFVQ